jgi:carbohydrate kinase (thermoresistant glucokinase family)
VPPRIRLVRPGIITCSALKRSYRQIIIGDRPEVRLVYLRGGRDLMAQHLAGRTGHFMPADVLQSQIDTLEEPDHGEARWSSPMQHRGWRCTA